MEIEISRKLEAGVSTYLQRSCPSCGTGNVRAGNGIAADIPAELRTFEEIKSSWTPFFRESSFFTYRHCANCDQLYCPVHFTKQQLTNLYSRMGDNTASLPVEVMRRTQRAYFKILKKFNAINGNYLEFGPDIGLLSEECAIEGQFSFMNLIEPNLEVHQELTASVANVPHAISSEMDAYRNIPNGSLDVVAMVHVFDHLLEPGEVLDTLRKKMKAGSKIMIVTHDESSLMAKVLKNRWPAYCLQHPQLYRPQTIRTALEKSGFRVLGSKKTYNYFPVTYLIKHLFWALRIGNIILPNWYHLTFPFKLGNIATVATLD